VTVDVPPLEQLVVELASDDRNTAEEAQFMLEHYGSEALDPVLEVLPMLNVFSRRCALDLLHDIGDVRAVPVLVGLLESEDEVVRERAGENLGPIGDPSAARALAAALRRAKAAGVPLHWSEPTTYRKALTQLGAREDHLPPTVGELAVERPQLGRAWRVEDLTQVADALAASDQALLYFQIWRWSEHHHPSYYWTESPGWEPQLEGPWPNVVEIARQDALDAVARLKPETAGAWATLEWIGEADR